jgi:hypothetical protein
MPVPQKLFKSRPHCIICGDPAPYGDERNLWIGAHRHTTRRLAQRLMSAMRRHWSFKNATDSASLAQAQEHTNPKNE